MKSSGNVPATNSERGRFERLTMNWGRGIEHCGQSWVEICIKLANLWLVSEKYRGFASIFLELLGWDVYVSGYLANVAERRRNGWILPCGKNLRHT